MVTKPKATANVDLAEIIDIPVKEFFDMPPAPGHRDSEGRAQKAEHLHVSGA
jgi:hypothetical protein